MASELQSETIVPDQSVASDEAVVPYNYKPKSESKLIQGFQFTFSNGIVKDRLLSILSRALDNVSNLGDKMVIRW